MVNPANGKSKPNTLKVKDLTATAKDRELWLNRMAAKFMARAAKLLKVKVSSFPAFRVGVGSTTKALSDYYDRKTGEWKGGLYGVTWHHSVSGDNRFEVVMSLFMGAERDVLDTLAHELVHVIDRNEHGHDKGFQDIATTLGLVAGPKSPTDKDAGVTWTNALCGDDLHKEMVGWTKAKTIGKYPHAGFMGKGSTLDILSGIITFGGGMSSTPIRPATSPAAQRNRYRKVTCPTKDCGYVVRMTKTMLEMGLPICGACHARKGKTVHMVLDSVEAAALEGTKKPGRPKGSKSKTKSKAKPKVKVETVTAVKPEAKPKAKAPAKRKPTAFRNLRLGEAFTRDGVGGVVWTKESGGNASWLPPEAKSRVTSKVDGREMVYRYRGS